WRWQGPDRERRRRRWQRRLAGAVPGDPTDLQHALARVRPAAELLRGLRPARVQGLVTPHVVRQRLGARGTRAAGAPGAAALATAFAPRAGGAEPAAVARVRTRVRQRAAASASAAAATAAGAPGGGAGAAGGDARRASQWRRPSPAGDRDRARRLALDAGARATRRRAADRRADAR